MARERFPWNLTTAEDTLRESEERLRTVTDIAKVGLVIVGEDRRYRYANGSYVEMLRLPTADIVGRRVPDVLGNVYETQVRPRLDRAFAGERVSYELSVASEDQARPRRFNVTYEPGRRADEPIVVVVVVDVTEQKEAIETLRQREEQLSLFIAHAPAALAMFDRDMRYVAASRRWLVDYGLPPDTSLVGHCHYDVFDVPDRWKAVHRRALDGTVQCSEEDSFVRPDGRTMWLKWEVRPWHATDGEVGGVLISTEDITGRKDADQALRESEQRFREIAETIREVFWVTNPDKTRMLYVSPGYEAIWGRSCESLVRSPKDWLDAIHPEDRPRIEAAAARQPIISYDQTYRILRPDGGLRWIHDRAFAIRDTAGNVVRVVGLASDVTHERTLEAQFCQAQKMEAIGRLAGGVAHDFNNILAVILGYAAMMRDALSADDPCAADADEIIKASTRASELTRQLLLFCRQEVVAPRVIDVSQCLEALRRMLARILGEDIELSLRAAGTWHVRIDPTHLDQVILNLAVNARDAMPDGGKLSVETSNVVLEEKFRSPYAPAASGPYLRVTVTDTGCGMDSATLGRLFEPFFTTKELGKGTGLGLSTVFGVVQRAGGTVDVRSAPGMGSSFVLYLPRAEHAASDVANSATSLRRAGTARILVVDDDPSVVKVIRSSLRRSGYVVVSACGPKEAIEIARREREPFDLVLTDVVMPDMGGRALARELVGLHPAIRVLFMSGYADDRAARGGVTDGAALFLSKPFTPASLVEKIEEVLQRPGGAFVS